MKLVLMALGWWGVAMAISVLAGWTFAKLVARFDPDDKGDC